MFYLSYKYTSISAYKSQIKSYVELLKDSCVLKQRSPLILHGMFDEFRTNPKRYKNPIELNPGTMSRFKTT